MCFARYVLPVLGLLFPGCEVIDPPPPPTRIETWLAGQMNSLRAEYQDMQLMNALHRARQLGVTVDRNQDSISVGARAELYQYLAQLHFQHFVYTDSVDYYTRRADALVNQHSPDTLRARQLLCAAYNGFEDWNWQDMQMQAQLGRRLLERAGQDRSLLNGLLLTIEGRAAKKYGDIPGAPTKLRDLGYAVSEDRYRRAVALLRSLGSPWENYAREQFAILLIRDPANDRRVGNQVDTLRAAGRGSGADNAYADRVRGYWRRRRGDPVGSTFYYRRLLRRDDQFLGKPDAEARYALEDYALRRGDYDAAIGHLTADMVRRSCCPEGEEPQVPEDVVLCDRRPSCIHFTSALAGLLQAWNAESPDPARRDLAYSLAARSVDRYERTFRSASEQDVLNKNPVLGDRLIASALDISMDIGERTRKPAGYHDAVFRAMELGKSILLTREISEAATVLAGDGGGAIAVRIRDLEQERHQIRKEFATTLELPIDRLLRFERLRVELAALGEGPERISAETPSIASALPSLEEVRRKLNSRQALVEFAETDSLLYVLYADRETSRVYRLPLDSVQATVARLIDLLTHNDRTGVVEYAGAAYEPYRQLLGPVADLLARREELIVIPSVSLAALPFAALTLGTVTDPDASFADLPYLVRTHVIHYTDSWRAERQYERLRQRPLAPRQARVGAWTHSELQNYLSATAEHVLANTASGGRHYQTDACSSSSFLADAANYDWLHLSVHATSRADRLHQNFLHLNRRDSLNGSAIGEQVLPARLVVLAACSTSRGVAQRWEGTFSMRRSFHRAGVPDVVASVYDIPAAATADLLEVFYTHLFAGCPPAEALAHAQRAFANGDRGARRTWPGAWAGLVVG
ncbi:CHAT domain-containing protein [Lewinella sp. JB7]|uniref:CHAT domain-containing protein n=1 Tax=Lewinella sp. JB7 TaxID=2962887 RepID=UPI0020C9E4C3|nr:CHAT domain-containing protein [Lewinella sp. JB7]MCP9234382.1 CHAT domain-containing protein [Lewinella sp. JB7]